MQISEYVSLGHPDKMADYISEYLLDRLIERDKNVRYALEVQIKDNVVNLAGEISSSASLDGLEEFVKAAVNDIGYDSRYRDMWGAENVVCGDDLVVHSYISKQSADIALGVDADGWGDQGIMFGMAVNSPATDYMPLDYYYAKKLARALFESKLGGLDIKTQIACDEGKICKVIAAVPLREEGDSRQVIDLIKETLPNDNYELLLNGTGRYVVHSSMGDCGTTGRKLAVDFYGGNCNVGGGSPWTKDGTKADLSLNIYARKKALEYLLENNLDYVKCGIGCCIGKSTVNVIFWDKNNREITNYEEDVSPQKLIKEFELDTPIYAYLCRNGLFSRIKMK